VPPEAAVVFEDALGGVAASVDVSRRGVPQLATVEMWHWKIDSPTVSNSQTQEEQGHMATTRQAGNLRPLIDLCIGHTVEPLPTGDVAWA
jgi:hypothetical protein